MRRPRLRTSSGRNVSRSGRSRRSADVPGRDGSVLREPVPERGMERRHQDRVRRVDSRGDRVAHHAVHVAVVGDVLGVAVVGAERDPVRPVLAHEREQRLQVARHRRLADEQPDARAKALAPLLDGQHLVVRTDARGGVRLQRIAEHAGCVPVDVLRSLERELRQLGVVTGDDAGEVHHLRQAEHALAAHERFEVAQLEGPPRRLEGRGWDARRRHEEDLELEARRCVVEPVDAVRPEHVRDLVRVGHDRGRPERQDEARELVGKELRRLDVHVRVDEARDDVAPGGVDLLATPVRAEACDEAVDDRDVGLEPFAGEDGQHGAATHHEVGGLVPAGDCKTAREVLHRRTLTSAARTAQRLAAAATTRTRPRPEGRRSARGRPRSGRSRARRRCSSRCPTACRLARQRCGGSRSHGRLRRSAGASDPT